MVTEVLKCEPGTRWVSRYVAGVVERQAPGAVAINDAGPARDIADELATAGVEPLLRLNGLDYAAACVRHADELAARSWVHPNHPALNAAAEAAAWRKVGQSRAWDAPRDPVTALSSASLAGWAFDHAPEPVKPLPKFWMG